MKCPKCNSERVRGNTGWAMTQTEKSIHYATYQWHKAHPAGALGTVASLAWIGLKGIASKVHYCGACNHSWRKWD
jgi:uncharacterized membrane protein